MRRPHAIATFFFALTAFVAAGGGVVVLVAPNGAGGHARTVAAATRPPQDEAVQTAATATPESAPEPVGPSEFALVENTPVIPRPDQPGRIVIPSIGLDAKVVEVGIIVEKGKPAWETAAFAVGFHRGTALPGTRGNAVLAGHISSPVSRKGDVFRRLPEVRIGDRVEIYVGDRRVTYEVSELRIVPPTAVQVLNQTDDATLTLITCYPDRVYNSRLVVVGKLV